MTRSEVFTTLGDVFLDRHIRVAETHQTHLVSLFRSYSKLLASIRVTTGLVVPGEFFPSDADGHGSGLVRLLSLQRQKLNQYKTALHSLS